MVNTSSFNCTHSNMKYWIQYVRQGVQGSSTSMEYSFSDDNHQFDTLSVRGVNFGYFMRPGTRANFRAGPGYP